MAFDYVLSVTLFHLVLVVPTLLYIGFKQQDSDPNLFFLLLSLGTLLLIYHTGRFISKYSEGKDAKINLFHLIVLAPIVMYVGYKQKEVTENYIYYMLIGIALVAGYYHSGYLFGYLHKNVLTKETN